MLNKNKKLLIDMDGTLAVWQKDKTLEEVSTKGYFSSLPAMQNVVDAVKHIIHNEKNIDVYILSSVLLDGHSVDDKKIWLKKYLPDILTNALFVPYGHSKAKYIKDFFSLNEGIEPNYFLLDDLTLNLNDWEAFGGTGIKIYNGINGTKGTWTGFSIHSSMCPNKLKAQLIGIINQF